MKIKESEIKKSKTHALVYINPSFNLVVEACIVENCSKCSYTCFYVVFHGSLDWGLNVCILILLISFKLDLKNVYTTKNRNESTICHLFLRRSHSHNRRAEKASFFKPVCFYG